MTNKNKESDKVSHYSVVTRLISIFQCFFVIVVKWEAYAHERGECRKPLA
jgi:hypothetical protein